MRNANLDGVVVAGTLGLAAPAALLLASMKPQVSAGAALLLVRRYGWKPLVPALVVVALSTLLWPEWIERSRLAYQGPGWGVSFFPWLLPVGLALLWRAWQRDDAELAACATPFLAPYIGVYSLAPLHAIVARRLPWLGALGWAALYAILAFQWGSPGVVYE